MINVQRGWRDKLENHIQIQEMFEVVMQTQGNAVYDCCCFGLDREERLSDDRYMIFYNQTESPEKAIFCKTNPAETIYSIQLSKLPDKICKLSFTVSIDGNGTMGQIQSHILQVRQNGQAVLELRLNGQDFQHEKAIITAEIYQKNGWRMAFFAHGFNGGLGDLLRSYGGEEETDTTASTTQDVPSEQNTPITQSVPSGQNIPITQSIPSRQNTPTAQNTFNKQNVPTGQNINAGNIIFAVPISLSSRIQPLIRPPAEFWYYGTRAARMPTLKTQALPEVPGGLGMANNELPVMEEILTAFQHSQTRVLVLFFSTGGVGRTKGILDILERAKNTPIFWQFIGIGGAGYGILDNLHFCNAAFFRVEKTEDIKPDMLTRSFQRWIVN